MKKYFLITLTNGKQHKYPFPQEAQPLLIGLAADHVQFRKWSMELATQGFFINANEVVKLLGQAAFSNDEPTWIAPSMIAFVQTMFEHEGESYNTETKLWEQK